MSDRLVTIASFSSLGEAYVARSILTAEGIDSYLADEHIVGLNWFYSIAVGGVKLRVCVADAETALLLIRSEPVSPEAFEEAAGELEEIMCPKCHSTDVTLGFDRAWGCLFIAIWWLFTIPPFLIRRWRCKTCGYRWRIRRDKR